MKPTKISARVVLDSISPHDDRLTTMEVTYPRFIHSEFMTHRVFSRNSASSRAIPVGKQLERLRADPALPIEYAYNQPGMQAADLMSAEDAAEAERLIQIGRDFMTYIVERLNKLGPTNPNTGNPLGLHKQWANRYLEPWMWHTVIVSATSWDGFWNQRCSPLAQPELEALADEMQKAYNASEPTFVDFRDYHTPYIQKDERKTLELPDRCQISSARCARVSYLTQNGVRDQKEDLILFERLKDPGDGPPHESPLEHVATPIVVPGRKQRGNLIGWKQFRHMVEDYRNGLINELF